MLIYVSLAAAGTEILVCMASVLLSCRIAQVAKEELSKQRDGMFYVKVRQANHMHANIQSGKSFSPMGFPAIDSDAGFKLSVVL